MHHLLLLLLLLSCKSCVLAAGAGAQAAGTTSKEQQHQQQQLKEEQQQGKWDHNYSCIFQAGASFTYLHIAYVTYFNVSKPPTYCSSDQCLDSCTRDCSCSAVVYDVPTTSCYQYHDLVPVQNIPFIPVHGRDTITAYIKVQHGYYYGSGSSSRILRPAVAAAAATLAAAVILV